MATSLVYQNMYICYVPHNALIIPDEIRITTEIGNQPIFLPGPSFTFLLPLQPTAMTF